MSSQRYLVTARKYRPQLFHEIVAQEHVTKTLQNAIRLERLAHAYLFSGPRGVGKTTAARILAKAINCTTPFDERPGGAEPCRTCDSCRSFEEGRNLNIIEIDAASNNKVDDIRELRETVRIPPQGNRKKVYIIDEVHMLSNAAFNALLKTLEEPPPYVLFIFATTEPHKVIPTILSRCQRFDFRRITVPEIIEQLRHICTEEQLTADESALMLIARKGDGALRDALSVFDQSVSLCGTNLQHEELTHALGVVDTDLFFQATQFVTSGDGAGMIQLVERIVRAGYDLQEFLDGLAEHLRNLLVAHSMPDTTLIETTEAMRARYSESSREFEEPDLLRLMMIVAEAEDALKSSRQPRLRLEMALLKMAALTNAADLRSALTKLDHLEELAGKGTLPSGLATPEAPVQGIPAKASPHGQSSAQTASKPAPVRTPPKPAEPRVGEPDPGPYSGSPTADVPAPKPRPKSAPGDLAALRANDDEPDFSPPPAHAPDGPARKTQAASPVVTPVDPGNLFGQPALMKRPPRDDGAPRNAFARDEGDVAVIEQSTEEPPEQLRRVTALWPRFVQFMMKERIHVGSMLQHATPLSIKGSILTVGVIDPFQQRLLTNQADFLSGHLLNLMGEDDVTGIVFASQGGDGADTTAQPKPAFDPQQYLQRKRTENPVLAALLERFGGELSW